MNEITGQWVPECDFLVISASEQDPFSLITYQHELRDENRNRKNGTDEKWLWLWHEISVINNIAIGKGVLGPANLSSKMHQKQLRVLCSIIVIRLGFMFADDQSEAPYQSINISCDTNTRRKLGITVTVTFSFGPKGWTDQLEWEKLNQIPAARFGVA